MGRTYASRTAHSQRYPVTDEYAVRASQFFGRRGKLAMCPHCSAEGDDVLEATVQQKGRRTVHHVPLLASGMDMPKANQEGSSMQILTCRACGRDVNPLAYNSPYAFLLNRANPEQRQRYIRPIPDDE